MADATSLQLSVGVESTYGTAPAGSLDRIRFSGESLKPTFADTESAEITSDRSTAAIIRTDQGAGGDISAELLYAAHDILWKNGLQSADATTADSQETGVTSAAGTGTLTATGIDASKNVGDWIWLSGSADGVDDGPYKIIGKATDTLTVKPNISATSNTLIVDHGSNLTNGSNFESLWVEKHFSDLTTTYAEMPGSHVTGFNLSAERGSVVNVGFTLMGQSYVGDSTSSSAGGYNSAPTHQAMSSIAGFAGCFLGGQGKLIKGCSFSGESPMRARGNMGSSAITSIGNASLSIGGTLTAYFENQTALATALADTSTSLAFAFQDPGGKVIVFDFPAVQLTDVGQSAGGKDTDIMEELSFKAFKDPTEGVMMRIASINV